MADAKRHWDSVYMAKGERDVSWFEAFPTCRLQMLEAAGVTPESCVLDVGGGDSRLVDTLSARGLTCLAVLDVSDAALDRARLRLGDMASSITWLDADVVSNWSLKPMDVWHDRARVPLPHRAAGASELLHTPPADAESGRHGHNRDLRARRPGPLQRASGHALFAGIVAEGIG
jgi:hypothetical protein